MKIVNRLDLADYFASLGFTRGAEIGVADGRYSEILLQRIPGLELLCVDPFYRRGHFEKATKRLGKYNANIIRKTSMEALYCVKKGIRGGLDFVFIDAKHWFDFVMEDVIGWSRVVRDGGIVSGHDYYKFHGSGVMEAVDTYTKIHKIKLNIIPEYHGGYRDDVPPCWWFKK